MSQSHIEKNTALVLEAFDTLFTKRDYARAERYWSPHYIQHSAHIEPGRDGLFNRSCTSSVRLIRRSEIGVKYLSFTTCARRGSYHGLRAIVLSASADRPSVAVLY